MEIYSATAFFLAAGTASDMVRRAALSNHSQMSLGSLSRMLRPRVCAKIQMLFGKALTSRR